MKIVDSILTKNPCYTCGRTITVKGLMLHSVGCPQPSAAVFVKNWNSASHTSSCVHAFIDANTGDVHQTLPWNRRGWHCASGSNGSGNNTHIGVEMCEPACIKYTGGANFTCSDTATAKAAATRTYNAAVELFAMLCKQFNLDPLKDGVILSHKEGFIRGIASNHGDPEHLWNQLKTGYTMDGFRKAVKAAMSAGNTITPPAAQKPVTGPQTATTGVSDMTDAEMFTFFKSKGLTDAGAAGLIGNLYAESALQANNLQNTGNRKLNLTDAEYTAAVDSGTYANFVKDGFGFGLAQWTYYTRKQALLDFMKAAKVSVGDKRKQCEFIMKELAGYPALLKTLKTTTSVAEASNAVLLNYERPASMNLAATQTKRAEYGQTFYDKFAKFSPYMVKVTATNLNIRTGPGTNTASKGYIKPGTYTIVEEKAGPGATMWGKLKSGAGWISLDFAKRL